MKSIGLFETKTRFSEICAEVAAKGVSVLVTRRGQPLVRIEPIRTDKTKSKGVWERRAAFIESRGPLTENVTPPARSKQTWAIRGILIATLNLRHFAGLESLAVEDWS